MPSFFDSYETPVHSLTFIASISALRATTLPPSFPSEAITPVSAVSMYDTPILSSSSFIFFDVSYSKRPSSGYL